MKRASRSPIYVVSLRVATFAIVVGAMVFASNHTQKSNSLNLTSVSDTLSTSRFSFVGRLAAGNTVGSSILTLVTTPDAFESTSSANLFVNDSVGIGDTNGITTYTVTGIPSVSQLQITPVIQSGDSDSGDFVIATRSASHTIALTTVTAVPNGLIRILIPTVTTDVNAKDGIPDRGGFDFGSGSAGSFPVTCPADVSSTMDFVTGTATQSAVTVGSTKYHAFECRYSGAGNIGQTLSMVIGNGSTALINPAPNATHVDGTADSYAIIVQQLNGSGTVIDQTTTAVAVVESVRVTATVDPQITFRIMGVPTSTSACSLTTNVTTTSTVVPLGTLSISSFTIGAQALSVSTNATNGYTVSVVENDQLGKDGNTCSGGGPTFGSTPCIPDSLGDSGTMSHTTTNAWTSTSNKGFGYTVADPNSTTSETFAAPNYKQFADNENSEAAQSIFTDSTVADNDNVYVCYKAVIGTSQQAGEYTNNLTYRATATF